MVSYGRFGAANDRFALPEGWQPASNEVLATARTQALSALIEDAARETAPYYDPSGAYAGTLFLDVEPNEPHSVEASDLYAVTTLSMKLHARHGRLILEPGSAREDVQRQLRSLSHTLRITDLGDGEAGSAETLARMYKLHAYIRDLLAGTSQRWVTAAKLCARKRPRLFPIRDNLVCEYLGASRKLKTGDGWPGDFAVDIQVYAYLMTEPAIQDALAELRGTLSNAYGLRVDDEDMRLLDAALWMKASRLKRI